ncbi:MAG TPA: hypothetical protein VMV69_30285 [Pirellulales bacterium]|nr:hypothetical protein [Pirellulales bacterium]
MRHALSRSRRATPAVLLERLGEAEVKAVCEAVSVSATGRRGELVARLLAEPDDGRDAAPAVAKEHERLRGINLCVDLSATPYFLGRVGQEMNRPFPWGFTQAVRNRLIVDWALAPAITLEPASWSGEELAHCAVAEFARILA